MKGNTKLWLLGILALAGGTHTAEAKNLYGMAGCGLGSVIIGPSEAQVFAATTNGSTYTQAFGISSGTSNCKTLDQQAILNEQRQFLAANLAALQKEMAQGGGETVVAFSQVLGCNEHSETASKTLVQQYDKIFAAPRVDGVLQAAKDALQQDHSLVQSCKHLS